MGGVSLALHEGQVLGLIGPNGSGKTTLFDVISGFQKPDGGRIVYDGVDVTDLPAEQRARTGLVRRFQDARLFPSLTVFETLLVSLEQRMEVRSTFLAAMQMPQARRAERRVRRQAERLIELLDLGAYRDKFVKELSTGLRRIVDLACVLATDPKVLLLDEPSSGIAQAEAEGLARSWPHPLRDGLQHPHHRARHASHLRRGRRAGRPRPGPGGRAGHTRGSPQRRACRGGLPRRQ